MRALTRAWEYRQRHRAKGTWHRLRRLLADAQHVCVITERDAAQLIREGCEVAPVGSELEPEKVLVSVSAERLAEIVDARPLAVRLSAELLAARFLALVRFPGPG